METPFQSVKQGVIITLEVHEGRRSLPLALNLQKSIKTIKNMIATISVPASAFLVRHSPDQFTISPFTQGSALFIQVWNVPISGHVICHMLIIVLLKEIVRFPCVASILLSQRCVFACSRSTQCDIEVSRGSGHMGEDSNHLCNWKNSALFIEFQISPKHCAVNLRLLLFKSE